MLGRVASNWSYSSSFKSLSSDERLSKNPGLSNTFFW
jgi:hypothetical protein